MRNSNIVWTRHQTSLPIPKRRPRLSLMCKFQLTALVLWFLSGVAYRLVVWLAS